MSVRIHVYSTKRAYVERCDADRMRPKKKEKKNHFSIQILLLSPISQLVLATINTAAAATTTTTNMTSSLTVYCAITAENGKRVQITVQQDNTTPTQLRSLVSQETKIPLGQLRLIFRGRMIKDDSSLDVVKEYKLEKDCVLHCMGKPEAASVSTSTPASVSTTAPAMAVPTPSFAMSQPSSSPPSSSSPPPQDPLQTALDTLRSSNSSDQYLTAVTTLDKILTNIIQNPMEEKYRKVKFHNAAFQKRLGGLSGGRQAILSAGFIQTTDESGTQIFQMQASADAWPKLQAAKAKVEQAVQQAKRQQEQAMAPPVLSPTPTTNFMNNSFGGMGMGMPPPSSAQAAMAADLLSNPQALQNMMQNPMVQQMIQNDPNVPPHVRQAMQQMANNPQMMQQVSQMMADPMIRQQMETAMRSSGTAAAAGGGGGGGFPAFGGMPNNNNMPGMFGGASGGGSTNSSSNSGTTNGGNNNNNNNSNDQSQTEEEMIAEAIRRSLQDN